MALRPSNKQNKALPARPPVTHVIAKAEQAAEDVLKALEKLRAKQRKTAEGKAEPRSSRILEEPKLQAVPPPVPSNISAPQFGSTFVDDDIFPCAVISELHAKPSPHQSLTNTPLPPRPPTKTLALHHIIEQEGDDLLSTSVIHAVEQLTSPSPRKVYPSRIPSFHKPSTVSKTVDDEEALQAPRSFSLTTQRFVDVAVIPRAPVRVEPPTLVASFSAKQRQSEPCHHSKKITTRALKGCVHDLRQEYRMFRGEAVAMLSQTDKAMQQLMAATRKQVASLHSLVLSERGKLEDVLEELHVMRRTITERDEAITTLHQDNTRLEAKLRHAEHEAAVFQEQTRRLRDMLAEVKGSIRVVCRVRPVIPADFREGSAIRVIASWLLSYAMNLSKFRRNTAAQALLCKLLGWNGSIEDLCRLLSLSVGVHSTGEAAFASDIGPVCIPGPLIADGSKEAIMALNAFPASAFFAALDKASVGGQDIREIMQQMLTCHACEGTQYSFDRVFWQHARQEDVFDEVKVMLDAALRGRNVCVMAHGATSSGKTHTLFGSRLNVRSDEDDSMVGGVEIHEEDGLVLRCMEYILRLLQKNARGELGETSRAKRVNVSIFEIYNEEMRDLLKMGGVSALKQTGKPTSRTASAKATVSKSAASDDASHISHCNVTSLTQFRGLLARAMALRASSATAANHASSRSHCIIRLSLREEEEETEASKPGKSVAVINLCDLAGAERVKDSRVAGAAMAEACHVNTSLTALCDCISALIRGATYVPFRNSTLTKVLEPTLVSPSRVLMLANISPLAIQREQSAATLRFTCRASANKEGRVSKQDAAWSVENYLV